MLEERKDRCQPHILSFAEEEKLLAVAPDNIRALAVLILENWAALRKGSTRAQMEGRRLCSWRNLSQLAGPPDGADEDQDQFVVDGSKYQLHPQP